MLVSCSKNDTVVIGVTTTLEDSGLLSELVRRFEASHDIAIKPVIAGSGQIHQLIRRGDIDSAITHDPAGESQLLEEGSIQSKIFLMKNDFLIVGPAEDPAGLRSAVSPEQAFKKIYLSAIPFVSRADNSGTHQAERIWWQRAGVTPDANHYLRTGTGMGATLAVAAERSAYTIVDRGTWLNFGNRKNLQVMFEDTEQMTNVYSILSLNVPAAQIWEHWLISESAQKIIRDYRLNDEIVFKLKS